MTIAALAADAEARRALPDGPGERFAGYGIMGLPFRSGHVLALRRFPASSIGPAYTAIWHRDPAGRWAFWQDQTADKACSRYFSAAIEDVRQVGIDLAWTGPDTLRVEVPELEFEWSATMGTSVVTKSLNAVAAILPDRLWRAQPVLSTMGSVAGTALRAGRVGLTGVTPNGQRFIANPLRVWLVDDAVASLHGVEFGPIGALVDQAALGDFWLPQRGIFALGRTYFDDVAASQAANSSTVRTPPSSTAV